jgi:hypothetical protein
LRLCVVRFAPQRNNIKEQAIRKALSVLLQRQEIEMRGQGKYICRRR